MFADNVGLTAIGTQTTDITTAYTGGAYSGPGSTYVGSGGVNSKTGRDDRASESALGDLVANALRDTLAPTNLGAAQIGVVNPGGLRDELFHKQTGVEGDGVITYAEANNVLPFVNNLWTTTLTGTQFKLLLEQQWQRDVNNNVPSRPYLQLGLSDNVTYTFDATLAEGSRITSITINGAPYDPAASYRIGTFSFLATGGDNFRAFLQGTNTRDSGLVDRDGWIAYLGSHKPVSPDFARQAVSVIPTPTTLDRSANASFTLSNLNLTSLGAPANSKVYVSLGGAALGSAAVTNGAATVNLPLSTAVPLGSQTLTVLACPSNTKVTIPVTVTGATAPAPSASPTVTSCDLQTTTPTTRIVDTRNGIGLAKAKLQPGQEVKFDVRGKYGVAADAGAVALNITADNADADGWVRAYPCGTPTTGEASNLNPAVGHVVANLAVVALDSTNQVCVTSFAATNLIVDLQGWYPADSDFTAVPLTRVADTRRGLGVAARLTPGQVVELQITGANGVPARASAAVLNLTAVADKPNGYVTAFPCGGTAPNASILNQWAGHAIANSAYVGLSATGKVCFVANIDTDLIVDLAGWFPGGSSYHAVTPVRALDTRTGTSVQPGSPRTVPIAGLYGVPSGATVASVNITATNASAPLFVQAYPCGQPVPASSNNNADPDRIVATQALVPIGTGGAICLTASATTDLIVDVEGYL